MRVQTIKTLGAKGLNAGPAIAIWRGLVLRASIYSTVSGGNFVFTKRILFDFRRGNKSPRTIRVFAKRPKSPPVWSIMSVYDNVNETITAFSRAYVEINRWIPTTVLLRVTSVIRPKSTIILIKIIIIIV